jgi:hypothetical protein
MNQSRYQQLLQRRFGQTNSPMQTVSFKALDAQQGHDDASREYQLKGLGLEQQGRDRSLKFARGRNDLANKSFKNELSEMKTANWLGAGGVALGLGQGILDKRHNDQMAEMYRRQQGYFAPVGANPNSRYRMGLGGR